MEATVTLTFVFVLGSVLVASLAVVGAVVSGEI